MYRTTRDESHYGLAIYNKKYLKAKKKNYGNSNKPSFVQTKQFLQQVLHCFR